MPNKSRTPARKPGAQPGNKNALKHGFYAKHFTDDETHRLGDLADLTVKDEIELLRVYVSRISQQLPTGTELDKMTLTAFNTLAIIAQTIGGLVRTEHLIKGKGGELEKGILEALEEMRLELGL